MSLRHVLLGMLIEPASGYDLRKSFEEGARHFWSARLSQIYPTLQGMERVGWLRSREEASEKGPVRRVYERTAEGTRALYDWLSDGPVVGQERFAYIGQLVFMGELGDLDRTAEFIKKLRERLEGTLAALEGPAHLMRDAFEKDANALGVIEFHYLLSMEMGVRSLRAKVGWCEDCLDMIREKQEAEARHG